MSYGILMGGWAADIESIFIIPTRDNSGAHEALIRPLGDGGALQTAAQVAHRPRTRLGGREDGQRDLKHTSIQMLAE